MALWHSKEDFKANMLSVSPSLTPVISADKWLMLEMSALKSYGGYLTLIREL